MNQILPFFKTHPYFVSIISFTIGYLFMPLVIEVARKYNFVVSPNKRTSHNGDIPNIGGINIFVSFLFTVFLFSYNVFSEIQFSILGLFIILIVGFIDDLIDIKASWKLIGELIAAFFLIILADLRISNFHGFLGIYELPLFFSYVISFFVFIVIVNSLNLIDGVDGLASGLGILYSLFFAVYFLLSGHFELSVSSFAMFGSLVVFFYYNVFSNKRKIFMGDSGSLLLGYMINLFVFSFLEMNAKHDVPPQLFIKAAPAVAISLLIVPLFDTVRVMVTRVKKGYSPFRADKNHVHHLLLSLGLKHKDVSFVLMGITIGFIIVGLIFRNIPNGVLVAIDFVFCLILTKYLWILVDRKKMPKTEQLVELKQNKDLTEKP
ncbi:MAG TPA: MraY family glycosyltransferase [Paludibacteraceae bacterium]|nr:MraY family glycosyltransferase [Paludibacteraceae bacterium]HPT42759.1 MraY family glycosyltransferase [Paludibacteraceae bacterium]